MGGLGMVIEINGIFYPESELVLRRIRHAKVGGNVTKEGARHVPLHSLQQDEHQPSGEKRQ